MSNNELPAHSRISPSSYDRTKNCPGWVNYSEKYGIDQDNAAATEGTLAHHAGAITIEGKPNAFHYTRNPLPPDEYGENETTISQEMAKHVQTYADYCQQIYNRVYKLAGGDKSMLVDLTEKRVSALKVHPEMHGTADKIIGVHFGELHIIDLKYGKHRVRAAKNGQLQTYGFCTVQTFGSFDPVYLHIYQPRLSPRFDRWKTTSRELIRHGFAWRDMIRAAESPKAKRRAGDWCWFCPGRDGKKPCEVYSKKFNKHRLSKAAELFEDIS